MTEGATEPVEQAVAPAAAPTGEPERVSLWERLKPLWWVRGFAGAIALIGAMEIADWPRHEWLRVPHAIATRWQEIVAGFASVLRDVVPVPIDLTPSEAVRLVGMSAIQFPIVLGYYARLRREYRDTTPRVRAALLLSLPFAVLTPMGPGDIVDDPLWGAVWGMVVLTPVCWAVIRYPYREVPRWIAMILVIPPLATATFLQLAGQDYNAALSVTMWALIAVVLWSVAKTYAKAMFAAFTFVLTLQAVYLVPQARQQLRPVIDWMDPVGATATP